MGAPAFISAKKTSGSAIICSAAFQWILTAVLTSVDWPLCCLAPNSHIPALGQRPFATDSQEGVDLSRSSFQLSHLQIAHSEISQRINPCSNWPWRGNWSWATHGTANRQSSSWRIFAKLGQALPSCVAMAVERLARLWGEGSLSRNKSSAANATPI